MEDEWEDEGYGSQFERLVQEMVEEGYQEWDLDENGWSFEANYIPHHHNHQANPHDILNL